MESSTVRRRAVWAVYLQGWGGGAFNQDAVPMWRGGSAGKQLQKGMVEVAARRLFTYGVIDQHGKPAFSSGAVWAAFARLAGPPNFRMDAVMERLFDTRDRWTDSVKALHRLASSGHTYMYMYSKAC